MLVRKIDCYSQVTVVTLSLLSVPVFGIYGFLFGLLILGCWQLISAAINTGRFIREGYGAGIRLYWMLSLSDIVLVLAFIFLSSLFAIELVQVFFWAGLGGGAGIAIYYFRIYFTLIERLSLNNELHGVIKSRY